MQYCREKIPISRIKFSQFPRPDINASREIRYRRGVFLGEQKREREEGRDKDFILVLVTHRRYSLIFGQARQIVAECYVSIWIDHVSNASDAEIITKSNIELG